MCDTFYFVSLLILKSQHQPRIGNYRVVKTIRKGTFIKVKLAHHILIGKQVAIKIIDKRHLKPEVLQKLYREVRILKMLNHPHIVKLFEVIDTKKHSVCTGVCQWRGNFELSV
uniref:non-specific serine/threonine protein kinase n=1 Tax=Marmota marmota marmota TaxID=9994 RepID=A0A8C6AAY3_MARMA